MSDGDQAYAKLAEKLKIDHLVLVFQAVRSIPDEDFSEMVCRNLDRTFAEGDKQSYAFWAGVSTAFDEMRERGYLPDQTKDWGKCKPDTPAPPPEGESPC